MSLLRLTDQLIGHVTGGAVFGPDGGIWSATPGFYGIQSEFSSYSDAFLNRNSNVLYSGIEFLCEPFIVTSFSDELLIAQKSSYSVIIMNCEKRCFVIGFHDEQIPFERCYNAVKTLANGIIGNQFEYVINM